MSRIGKKPILLPAGVEATVSADQIVVKGPKGTLTVKYPPHTSLTQDAATRELNVKIEQEDNLQQRALWGLARQLVNNAVLGVQKPYEKALEFIGVGFRVALVGRDLKIEVGFSHPVLFKIPEGITATVDKQIVTISGIDKHLVGETAARIRRIKPPEPYKGKGIKYTTETIRRKAGKTATK